MFLPEYVVKRGAFISGIRIYRPCVVGENPSNACLHTRLCSRNSIYARKRSHTMDALGSLTTKDFVDYRRSAPRCLRL